MSAGARYAVYFVPTAESTLFRFGTSVLGYDSYVGVDAPFFAQSAFWPRPWAGVVREPRRYGFHATLVAPFFLHTHFDERDLLNALARFSAAPHDIPVIHLTIRRLSSFVALTPLRPVPRMQQLAAECVRTFDCFRAALTASDRTRRSAAGLTRTQMHNLDRWGYPYVFNDFQFHMTLAGPVEASELSAVFTLLENAASNLAPFDHVPIDHITLLRQDKADQPFRVIRQWPLVFDIK